MAQIEEIIKTDRAQFGFQEVIQIEQASLRVAALIREVIYFIMVLDLSEAYDTVLKALLIEKLQKVLPSNLVQYFLVFITTVRANVSGDITNKPIPMRRCLIKGGTSSPPLFKLFINGFPTKLRMIIKTNFATMVLQNPAILVADDFIAFSAMIGQMQAIADECCR